jgi:hypothetical protein
MTPHAHDHTTPTPTGPTPVRGSTPARVETALSALDAAFLALGRCPSGDDQGWADYSTAMALICARRAGWWRVLLTDQRRTRAQHPVHTYGPRRSPTTKRSTMPGSGATPPRTGRPAPTSGPPPTPPGPCPTGPSWG